MTEDIKREVSVSIRLTFPNLGAETLNTLVAPVIDQALRVGAVETFVSIYPYDPDEEES